jgi:secreted PhoX family phosphatase
MGDCSGGQTPWGTIITAEENVQDYYGDLEETWDSDQAFVAESGFDPGALVSPDVSPSESSQFGSNPNPDASHNRDLYGYLTEIDVGQPSGEYDGKTAVGVGHKKLGYMGRARWENATFVVDQNWQLIDGQPVVLYSGDDRRGGRIYKWVSDEPFTKGMSRAEIRALLDVGTLYVAHFADLDNATGNTLVGGGIPTEADPGQGTWIEISLDSTDVAPNATALGQPGLTVGEALQDTSYNALGGFATDDDVRRALFTASAKVGVRELNRPEDLEWRAARDKTRPARLFVAFTNHTRKTQLDQDGVVFDPAEHDAMSPERADIAGRIFAIEEDGAPAASTAFSFFQVWGGTEGAGDFDAADPDNILIDADGDVWFGTDGNLGTNGHADAIYYLDLDPAHQKGDTPTFGLAFRVVAMPSDAESSGPAMSSGMGSLFVSVQHPGEEQVSSFPAR